MTNKKLFSVDDCEKLANKEIRELYKKHVNPTVEKLWSSFSIGEVVASTTAALTRFMDTGNWAEGIVKNVKTLIGIQNIKGYNTFDKTNFLLTMGAIALGLIAFALGEGAKGMSQSLTKFSDITRIFKEWFDDNATRSIYYFRFNYMGTAFINYLC